MIELPNGFNEASIVIQAAFLVWYEGYLGKAAPDYFDLDSNTQEAYFYRFRKIMREKLEKSRERQNLATEESCLTLHFFKLLSVRTKNALVNANTRNFTEEYTNPLWLAQQADSTLLAVHKLGRRSLQEIRAKLEECGIRTL